jgi:hypothetical protein
MLAGSPVRLLRRSEVSDFSDKLENSSTDESSGGDEVAAGDSSRGSAQRGGAGGAGLSKWQLANHDRAFAAVSAAAGHKRSPPVGHHGGSSVRDGRGGGAGYDRRGDGTPSSEGDAGQDEGAPLVTRSPVGHGSLDSADVEEAESSRELSIFRVEVALLLWTVLDLAADAVFYCFQLDTSKFKSMSPFLMLRYQPLMKFARFFLGASAACLLVKVWVVVTRMVFRRKMRESEGHDVNLDDEMRNEARLQVRDTRTALQHTERNEACLQFQKLFNSLASAADWVNLLGVDAPQVRETL